MIGTTRVANRGGDPLPLANVITLGTVDFKRLRRFYAAVGLPIVHEDESFAVFELPGAVLALILADALAADGGTTPAVRDGGIRFSLALLVARPEDVDSVVATMQAAGATVTKPPVDAEFFDGRSAYVADPENNYWEIAWAPPDNPVVAAATRAVSARRQ